MIPVLRGGNSTLETVFFYRGNGLFAVRCGRFKAHLWTWDNTPNPVRTGDSGGGYKEEDSPACLDALFCVLVCLSLQTGPDQHPGDSAEFCPGQITPNVTTSDMRNRTASPVLFDLFRDPGERYPIPPTQPEYGPALVTIRAAIAAHLASLIPGPPQLNWCDDATGNWAPPGCAALGLCLPVPPSNRSLCSWTH